MVKNILLAALLLGSGLPAFAEGQKAKPSSLMTWFQNLKNGLRESSVSGRMQKGRRVSSVAAVRGSAQGDDRGSLDEGVMKQPSSSRKAKRRKQERAAFESAIDLIMAGKTAEGISALEAFEKQYPKSSLLEQVAEAKSKAKELTSVQDPEAEKPGVESEESAEDGE